MKSMDFVIRKFFKEDKKEVLDMMQEFYSSDAVSTNGSLEIFSNDFDTCISSSPFLEGYIFIREDKILGYGMIAKSFSTEFGKPCLWLEDLYLKKEYRGLGIIPEFIRKVESENPNTILRLEVEEENSHAVHVYNKCGFEKLPYAELKKEI